MTEVFSPAGNKIEDFRVDTIDPRELVGSWQSHDFAVDVGDSASIEREVERRSMWLHREGGGIV